MTTYYATIRHSSIASAREIKIEGALGQAKRAATKEFGGEFLDYRIVIGDERGQIVSSREVRERRWTDSNI